MMTYNGITLPSEPGEYQEYDLYVNSGDTASNITVNADGRLFVYGGRATSVTLNAGGTLDVSSGTVSGVTVSKGAFLNVSGGTVANATFRKGAVYRCFTFTADTTCVNLKTFSNVILTCSITIGSDTYSDAKTLSNVTIKNGIFLDVDNGGKATNVTINAGGVLEVRSGTVSGVTICKGAFLNVSGGTVSNLTFKKGAVYDCFTFTADTTCSSLKILSNVSVANYCSVGTSGNTRTVSNVTVGKGATLYVNDGGRATNITVNYGGSLRVDGGTVAGITFKKGAMCGSFTFTADTTCASLKTISNVSVDGYCSVGEASFCDAKTVSNVTIKKNGYLSIGDGGKVTNLTLNAGGSLQIDSGKVSNLTVNKGYSQLGIMDTGTVSNVTFKKGAAYRNFTFTADTKCANLKTISNVKLTGDCSVYSGEYSDAKTVSLVTVCKNARMYVEDGGKATNVTVSAYGWMDVTGTGKASNVTINVGGTLSLSFGGTASGVTVMKGASLSCYQWASMMKAEGGKVSSITVKKGGIVNGLIFAKDTKLKDLSKISDVTMETGNHLDLLSKQTISNVTLNGKKTKLNVYGGTVTGATIGKDSTLQVKESGKASSVTVKNGGKLGVEERGTAASVTVESGGWLELDGGKASTITVKKGGKLDINDNGTATNITLKKGATINGFSWAKDMIFKTFQPKMTDVSITTGGEAWISGNQTISNFTVTGKGTKLAVECGAKASDITVGSGAELVMCTGGKVTNITVKKGGKLNGITFKADTKYATSADFLNTKFADNTDDTWKAASKQKATLSGKAIEGWIGLKDAKDFIKIQIQEKGQLWLDFDDSAKHAYEDGKFKFSMLNSSGKAIKFDAILEKDLQLTSQTTFAKGSICYLGISCTDKNYYNDYSIKTGVIASA